MQLFVKRILLLLIILISVLDRSTAQSFEIRDGHFMLDGRAFRIYGGEMHYARIPRQYWQHRIEMAKAMGCNTLSVYVFWNYHETSPGIWDWDSDSRDLRSFLETAKAEGMYVVLRPGPYTCAEWDFGGFPYWLSGMKLRSNDKAFLDSCRVYLQQVFRQVDGLFIEQGGNIIMTQIENEYGSFSFDMQFKLSHSNRKKYMERLADVYREVGFRHTLFTCDGGIVPVVNFAQLGHIKGVFPGTNDSKFLNTAHHTVRRFYSKNGPYYIPEEYAGWFTHWGDSHVFHRDVDTYKTHIEALLKTDFSFCYYMVHGGTNFGFASGTNYRKKNEVWPILTSYDYGAPITEGGYTTPLYDSLRAVYQRATQQSLPDVPGAIATMKIDKIELTGTSSLFDAILSYQKPAIGEPKTFEQLNQSGGYVLYEKRFSTAQRSRLYTAGITDYAQIYLNDSLVYIIDRNVPVGAIPRWIAIDIPDQGDIKILVENMGRVNFGRKLWANRKGATKGIIINGKTTNDWLSYSLPMDEAAHFSTLSSYRKGEPVFYTGTFDLMQTADTYINMTGFDKGIVFVNGHNLGRYWEVGPQYSLYLPGVWLRQGKNEIIVFDQLNDKRQYNISTTARPINR